MKIIPLGFYIFGGLFLFLIFAVKYGEKRHLLCTLEAHQQLKRLRQINSPQKKIIHLRSVNPFVFEEMILTALKRKGHKIKRNKRYTGDGGIDGQVFIKGHHYLIQAKRYKSHINPAHVQEFIEICNGRGTKGLFVHTGKTGKKSASLAKNGNMQMISGERLLKLFTFSDFP